MIRIRVYGTPAPQGSKRAFPMKKGGQYTGRVAVVEQNSGPVKTWRADVVHAAVAEKRNIDGCPHLGPVEVLYIFFMPRPKSHYGTGRNANILKPSAPKVPATSPDLDKLARSTGDALTTAGIWTDDGQVWSSRVVKLYASHDIPPGADIVITPGVPPTPYLSALMALAVA